jgi:hypothetical protein
MATYNLPYVTALILESPYDRIESIKRRWGWSLLLIPIASPASKPFYNQSQKNNPQPLDVITKINKDVPMLFINSSGIGTRNLYYACEKAGYTHAYCNHHSLCPGIVHAFYKEYHLPHNPEVAQEFNENFRLKQHMIQAGNSGKKF